MKIFKEKRDDIAIAILQFMKSIARNMAPDELPLLVSRAHEILLSIAEVSNDGDEAARIINSLPPLQLTEVLYFGRMYGPSLYDVINILGTKLGDKISELPQFHGKSQFDEHISLKVGFGDTGVTLPLDPSRRLIDIFNAGSFLHFGLYNYLYQMQGERAIKHALDKVAEGIVDEARIADLLAEVLEADSASRQQIQLLVEDYLHGVPHDQSPELRALFCLGEFSIAEVSSRVRRALLNLEKSAAPVTSYFAREVLLLHPRYRAEGLEEDLIDVARVNMASEVVRPKDSDSSHGDAARLAEYESFLSVACLRQPEIDRVACRGILAMTGGQWIESQDKGADHAIAALLDIHLDNDQKAPGKPYSNRLMLFSLIRSSDEFLAEQAAARKDEYALALYAITGRASFLNHVKHEVKRDRVFSSDLGL